MHFLKSVKMNKLNYHQIMVFYTIKPRQKEILKFLSFRFCSPKNVVSQKPEEKSCLLVEQFRNVFDKSASKGAQSVWQA